MADNLFWANKYEDETEYEGPWQLWKRDIDPTIWLRATNDSKWDEFGKVWWSPYTPILVSMNRMIGCSMKIHFLISRIY